jgi:hypothetical protein
VRPVRPNLVFASLVAITIGWIAATELAKRLSYTPVDTLAPRR